MDDIERELAVWLTRAAVSGAARFRARIRQRAERREERAAMSPLEAARAMLGAGPDVQRAFRWASRPETTRRMLDRALEEMTGRVEHGADIHEVVARRAALRATWQAYEHERD